MAKRPLYNCILALTLALGVTACAAQAPPPEQSLPPSQPTLSVEQPQQPQAAQGLTLAACPGQSFHPVLSANRVNLTLAPLMYESLFQLDPSFQPQPVLCRGYAVSEDGLTWTFTLEEGVSFSDGTPLTAALAAQALNLARGADSHYAGRFSSVSSISANRDGQLVISLTQPNSSLPALLDVPVALGSEERPLGTGPYVLTGDTDESLSLELRADWWQGTDLSPAHIPLFPADQTDDLIHGFDSGAITLLNTDPTGTNVPGYSAPCETVDYSTTQLICLVFNTDKGVFRSTQARCAAAAALDRDEVVSSAYAGHGTAAGLPVHPASSLYDPSLALQQAEADEVRELFAQARLTGQKVTLVVNRENSCKAAAAELIARQLEDAGLIVTLSRLSWSDYVNALAQGQFDLYLAEVALTADFDLSPLVGSTGALNYGRWSSPDTDALLAALRACTEGERGQASRALYEHLTQECPLVPLCFKSGSVLTQWGRLANLTPTRSNVFYQLEHWIIQ